MGYVLFFKKIESSLVKRWVALLSLKRKQERIAVCLKKPLGLQIHIWGLNLTTLTLDMFFVKFKNKLQN